MILTYKYRLYPTKAQEEFLNGQLAEACELYNCALQERIGAWKTCRKSVTRYEQSKQIAEMRKDGCLLIVTHSVAQDVLTRLDLAFAGFFRRLTDGGRSGYPRFRSSRRYDSMTYPSLDHGFKLFQDGLLRLQGAGYIKIALHRQIGGVIKTCTIKRQAGRWFACFAAECNQHPLVASDANVGIDVGLKSFATLSDGAEIENPRYHRKAQIKLRIAGRKVSRRKTGSSRRRKAVQLLQRAHVHVANQRSNFHHKESRKIVNSFGLIAVEDLNIKGLSAGMLAKSVRDAGWSQFLNFLAYKAECAGREFVKVDPRGTSQTCLCGQRVAKTLSDRWHHCPACGLSGDRDHVSARVILSRAGNRPSGANVAVPNACVA